MNNRDALILAEKDAATRAAERIERLFYGHRGYQSSIRRIIEDEWQRAHCEAERLTADRSAA